MRLDKRGTSVIHIERRPRQNLTSVRRGRQVEERYNNCVNEDKVSKIGNLLKLARTNSAKPGEVEI